MVLSSEKLRHGSSLLTQGLDGRQDAIQAMGYTLKALKCAPDNYRFIETLPSIVRAGQSLGVQWGEEVNYWLQVLENMRAKKTAQDRLIDLRAELRQQIANIEKYKKNNNIFSAGKIKNAEETIRKIEKDISNCEKAAQYEPPRMQL